MKLHKANGWRYFLMGVIIGAVIAYVAKKHAFNMSLPASFKTFPAHFRHVETPPKVRCIYPDRQTFAFKHDSPIWIEFDTPMNTVSITKETVIVRSSASTEPIKGLLDAGSRIMMFRPYGDYPMDESGAEITITLIGTETGEGVILDEKGIALDGDNDGKAGGDFVYTYRIIR